jgi:hypothetical protein
MSAVLRLSLPERMARSSKYREDYPGFVPVITQVDDRSFQSQALNNRLNLVPFQHTVQQLASELRRSVRLSQGAAMALSVGGKYLLVPSQTIEEAYRQGKAEDEFLYVLISDQEQLG